MMAGPFCLALFSVTAFVRECNCTLAGEVILTPQTRPHRIDVHHHHASPAFIAEIKARQTGQQPLMDWTPARSIEEMERAGV